MGDERRDWFTRREAERSTWNNALDRQVSSGALIAAGIPVKQDVGRISLREWLRFPAVELEALTPWLPGECLATSELAEEVAEDATYAPYLERQDAELRDLRASEQVLLGEHFPYRDVPGLSNEMVERLAASRPANLAAAGRVRGVTPAALAALLVHARRLAGQQAA